MPQFVQPPHDDRKILIGATAGAVVLHVAVLLVPWRHAVELPPAPEADTPTITITRVELQPPRIERPVVAAPRVRTPVPWLESDVRPSERPVDERPVVVDDPLLADWDPALEGVVGEAPPPTGPLDVHAEGVVAPVGIDACRVRPDYPPLAQLGRREGTVVLSAVIDETGRVIDLEPLSSPRAELGFVEAAIEAVKRWCYEPATLDGRPVAVRMRVTVTFTLN